MPFGSRPVILEKKYMYLKKYANAACFALPIFAAVVAHAKTGER